MMTHRDLGELVLTQREVAQNCQLSKIGGQGGDPVAMEIEGSHVSVEADWGQIDKTRLVLRHGQDRQLLQLSKRARGQERITVGFRRIELKQAKAS